MLTRNAAGVKHKLFLLNKDGTQKELILSWVASFIAVWCVLFSAIGASVAGHQAPVRGRGRAPAAAAAADDLARLDHDRQRPDLKLGDGLLNGLARRVVLIPDNVKAGTGILGATVISGARHLGECRGFTSGTGSTSQRPARFPLTARTVRRGAGTQTRCHRIAVAPLGHYAGAATAS
ncbi:hypothetical protein ACU686_21675 [Yinghuangia aomiensis]